MDLDQRTLALWGGSDVAPKNVLADAHGQLKIVDLFFVSGRAIVSALTERHSDALQGYGRRELLAFLQIPVFADEQVREALGRIVLEPTKREWGQGCAKPVQLWLSDSCEWWCEKQLRVCALCAFSVDRRLRQEQSIVDESREILCIASCEASICHDCRRRDDRVHAKTTRSPGQID